MTPDNPQDPQKGKVEETTPDEAAEAKAEVAAEQAEEKAEAKPKRTRAKKAAEPKAAEQAAAETGVDKEAAEATEAKPKPKRTRAKKTEDKPAEEKAPAKQSTRKRDRRPEPQPGVLVQARARYVRTSARKARLVCDHIRGKDVAEARAILAFTPRAAAKPWLKLLESAVANAEHNHELVGEELRIAAVHADEGPTLKRFRPRAMGRATRIRKRTSHLSITLTPKES
jgi:large subunit ribosomal protein L22